MPPIHEDPFDDPKHESNEMNRMLGFTLGLGAAAVMLTGMACGDAKTPLVTPSVTPGDDVQDTTLGDLFASPDRYNSREIILEGFYFHGWESNLLSERMESSGLAEGHLWPQGQKVWVEGSIPTEVYDRLHQQEMMGPLERYGKVRIKGTFQYGDRYGHLGGFDAQIVLSEVELLPWSPPSEQ
ncbi:MAG: hypothetical protein CL696_10750 [Chloroflexi bacterium]|nr:hypothetical protein [Chloroflexota bacterium]|tara:strand:- start:1693 stop:2241 length:549 start_codon:yes stop_codon:yes gene_type:complete